MKKLEIEKKTEAALNSLEHVARVGPGPFFYTRLQARLRKDRTVWERASGFIAQPAVAFSVICLIVSLNTFVIFKTETTTQSFIEQKNSILSDDSDSDVFAFYDEENNNTDAQ